MKRFIFYLTLFILTISCSKEINYELSFEGEKIVVNSFFSSNIGFVGSVSKTVSPTGEILYDNLKLNDALFIVFENGSPFDTLQSIGDGWYEGGKYPSYSRQYNIVVSKPGLETATSAFQKLPSDFEIEIINKRKNVITPLNKDFPTLDFELLIKDAELEKNYYFIEASLIINGETTSHFNFWLPDKSDFSADPCQTDEFFFPDDCFNGQDYVLKLAMETKSLDQEIAQEVEITVKGISQDYYEYLKSNLPQPEGFEVPFTEPNFIFSNIINGYGIFGGFSENKIIIEI